VVCPKCNSDIPDDSDFCARCGNPVKLRSAPQQVQSPALRPSNKRATAVAVVLAATAVIVGGLLMYESTEDRGTHVQQMPEPDGATSARLNAAISRCDSMARAKLYLPETMEFVREPEAYDLRTTLSVAREIAARDKYGKRYRYRYICIATADGQSGWTGWSVELMPTSD
jgi:hypothetical protein